jgi:hypothetical protein
MRAHGYILAIQEQRFRLKTDSGQVYLFTLDRRAPLDAADLHAWMDQRAPVAVDYSGEPNLAHATVHTIEREP